MSTFRILGLEKPCIVHPGPYNNKGYASKQAFRLGINKIWGAHVLAWIDANNMLPTKDKPFILHYCDNPPCIEESHLWAGTNQDNVNDMVSKNRQTHGERNGMFKLTTQQVEEIREKYATDKYFQYELATEYRVTSQTISRIVNRVRRNIS